MFSILLIAMRELIGITEITDEWIYLLKNMNVVVPQVSYNYPPITKNCCRDWTK